MLKLLKRVVLALVIALALFLGYAYIKDPVLTTRLLTLDQGPEVLVRGGPPLVIGTHADNKRSLSPAARAAAIAYGERTDSHALLIYHNGGIELEHYYPGHSATSITPTQSMHKSVLAMLIGIAIEDGYILSVDTPASVWIHEWQGDERKNITIRQMLQQVSGIDFSSFSMNFFSGFYQLMLGDDIRPYAINNGVLFPPDTEFDYNSVNPQVLGILLQRATGMPYADYLSKALWQKIGAPDASVVIDSTTHGMARTFCCLQATARSWLHVGLLHLNKGEIGGRQVVPAEWIARIQQPGAIQPNYGYLTWLGSNWEEQRFYNRKTSTSVLHTAPFAADDVVYFDGMGGQRVYIAPSAGLVVVRTGAIAMDWDDAKLPNLILQDLAAD